MIVGVIAVQGDFAEHEKMLGLLGVEHFQIRQAKDLNKKMDGLIIPGGESTVIGKLLRELGMMDRIKAMIQNGLPVFGTCAGLILLSENIFNDDNVYIGTMPICVKRNAYGRQLGSFTVEAEFKGIGKIPMEFIRAPVIDSMKDGVEILATVNGKIVAAKFGKQLVTAFHPELTSDLSVYQFFIDLVST